MQLGIEKVIPNPIYSGILCLSAIARFHGLDFAEGQIAHISGVGTGKVDPSRLVQVAGKVGLTAKLVNLTWKRLGRLGQVWPAILILRNGETVILSGLREADGKPEIVTRDPLAPNLGFQFWGREEAEKRWGGQVILLKRPFALTDANQPFSLRWFVPEFLRQRRALLDVIAASLMLHILALATPIVGSSRVDLQACKLEYSIVSPK